MGNFDNDVKKYTSGRSQKQLWVVTATLKGSKEDMGEHLEGHFSWVLNLEEKGHLFAAGPLVDKQGGNTGNGMLIFNAEKEEDVSQMLESDPFYAHGIRHYEIQAWQVNVGKCQLSIKFSDQSGHLL